MAKSNRNPTPAAQSAAAAAFDVPDKVAEPSNEQAPAAEETLGGVIRSVLEEPVASNIISPETPAVAPLVPARQGDPGRPYCPKHQCLMRANGTREQTTTYTCPVATCSCSEKRARPAAKIPREPMPCNQRVCGEQHGQQFLEVVDRLSNAATLHMQCPKCKFSVKVPRAQFAQLLMDRRRRPPREDLSER